jgi:hypothetical protein
MTRQGDPMRDVVDRLVPAVVGANDWADVMRRGAAAARPRLRRPALALLAALIVTVPALAATGAFHRLLPHPGPAIDVSAELHDAAGARSGRFEAELPGVFAGHDRRGHLLPHRLRRFGGRRAPDAYPLRWRVELTGGSALSGRIVYRPRVAHAGRTVALLCRPCAARAAGDVTLTRTGAALLLNGQLAVMFETGNGTVIGVVPRTTQNGLIPRPRRR